MQSSWFYNLYPDSPISDNQNFSGGTEIEGANDIIQLEPIGVSKLEDIGDFFESQPLRDGGIVNNPSPDLNIGEYESPSFVDSGNPSDIMPSSFGDERDFWRDTLGSEFEI